MGNEYKTKLWLVAVAAVCLSALIKLGCSERVKYWAVERPRVAWLDREYIPRAVFKSRLLSRKDPVHYVTLNYTTLKTMDNNFMVQLYFYQLLSNVYKRSFVEIHSNVCDFMEKELIIGEAFREVFNRVPPNERPIPTLKCPLLPGNYSFINMKFRLSGIVDTFPFPEGRVYINVTDRAKIIARGSIDFVIQVMRTKK